MMPKRVKPDVDLADLRVPEEAQEPILARPVRNALLEWLQEIWAADALAEVGLQPRRRALFHGAPGTGKTTLAHHLAARLGLPLAVVRPDDIVGMYIGQNTVNLKAVFDAAERFDGDLVLFFDEFDSAAQKRMTDGGGGNPVVRHAHNAMINTMLARLDTYCGIVIAATNLAGDIDPGIWRRFEIQIELKTPGRGELRRILALYLDPFGLPRDQLDALAEAFATAAPALVRQFCEGLKRQIVLGPNCDWDMRRDAVVDRLVASFEPAPGLGKPRLWSHGGADAAIRIMDWPLRRASEIGGAPAPAEPAGDAVVVPLDHGRR